MAPSPGDDFVFRKAGPADIPSILSLIAVYAKEGLLLPRTREDLLLRIGNFHVAEIGGEFAGCVALRHYGNELYEVRSLALHRKFRNRRLGSRMVSALLDMMRDRGEPARVFALTYRDAFFLRLGFRHVDKKAFPEKIWSDCTICPKKDCCDEIAVMIHIPSPGPLSGEAEG